MGGRLPALGVSVCVRTEICPRRPVFIDSVIHICPRGRVGVRFLLWFAIQHYVIHLVVPFFQLWPLRGLRWLLNLLKVTGRKASTKPRARAC